MKNILLLYKTSAYETYFSNLRNFPKHLRIPLKEARRFQETHECHYQTLAGVEAVLKSRRVSYTKARRGRNVDFSKFDWIITVGGDGTFLEAARNLTRQLIMGINSDPQWSVGQFCIADKGNYVTMIDRLLEGRYQIKRINRMQMVIQRQKVRLNVLNDVLICHKNPAAMSRYYLTIGGKSEEQKSSGIWVATAAGSTGAIRSAGGKIFSPVDRRLQYMVREIYDSRGRHNSLRGGVIRPGHAVKIMSLMKDGIVFVDGAHVRYPFHFGEEMVLRNSPQPLKVMTL